jgi:hypothetical protein
MVPVSVGLVLCGVSVNVFPETQYEYPTLSAFLITSFDAVYEPVVDGPVKASPGSPV